MNLAQFTEPDLVALPLRSDWRNDAIRELSLRLHDAGRIENAGSFAKAALQHDSLGSGVFDRIAFSFARSRAVRTLSFALGIAPRGVSWKLDGSPVVYTVVLVAVPWSEEKRYCLLLEAFSQLLNDRSALIALCRCVKAEEACVLLSLISAT